MIFPRRTYHLLDTAHNGFGVSWLHQDEIVSLRSCSEFQTKALCTGKSAGFHKLIILFDVERIRPPGLVLIINHTGTSAIILGQFKWKYKLVAFGCAVSRWHDQPIIGIDKDNITSVKLVHRHVMPFPAKHLPLHFVCTRKIKHLRIKGCLQNIRALQCIDLPLACIYDLPQHRPQLFITSTKRNIFQIANVPPVTVMRFVRGQIPVNTNGQSCSNKLASFANGTGTSKGTFWAAACRRSRSYRKSLDLPLWQGWIPFWDSIRPLCS